jgi:hypothetical protein
MAMIVLPDDLPDVLVELTSSSLEDVRAVIRLPPHWLRSSGMTAERYYGRGC